MAIMPGVGVAAAIKRKLFDKELKKVQSGEDKQVEEIIEPELKFETFDDIEKPILSEELEFETFDDIKSKLATDDDLSFETFTDVKNKELQDSYLNTVASNFAFSTAGLGKTLLKPAETASAWVMEEFMGVEGAKEAMKNIHEDYARYEEAAREKLHALPWYYEIPTEILTDIVPLLLAGKGASAVLKGGKAAGTYGLSRLILKNPQATAKLSRQLLHNGTHGALFSVFYDLVKGEKVSPTQALVFMGLEATGPLGKKFLKYIKPKTPWAKSAVKRELIAKENADLIAKELQAMEAWKTRVNKSIDEIQGELFNPGETFAPVRKVKRKLGETLTETTTDIRGRKVISKVKPKDKKQIDLFHEEELGKLPIQEESLRPGETLAPVTETTSRLGEYDIVEKVKVLGKEILEEYETKGQTGTLDLFFDHDLKDKTVGLIIKRPRKVMNDKGKFDTEAAHLLRKITNAGRRLGLIDDTGKVDIDFVKVVRQTGVDFLKNRGVNSITKKQGKLLLKHLENFPKTFKETAKALENTYDTATIWSKITPSLRYVYSLNAQDLLLPGTNARLAMENVAKDNLEFLYANIRQWRKTSKLSGKSADRELWEMLDKFPTAEAAGLTGEMAQVFKTLRDYTEAMLSRVNQARSEVGLPNINRVSSYITHIFDAITKKELKKKNPISTAVELALDKTTPNKIFNPTAETRRNLMEGVLKDPMQALRTMTHYDLKEIYLNQPNKVFKEQFKYLVDNDKLPASTAKWIQAYWNQNILGFPTELDNITAATWEKMGFSNIFNTFNRSIGIDSFNTFSNKLRELVHLGTIWGSIRQPIRNMTQKFQTLALYGPRTFKDSLRKTSPELEKIMAENTFLKNATGKFLDLSMEGYKKLTQIGFMPYKWSHISNTKNSFKAGYIAAKKLGWTEAEAIAEAEFSVMTSQYFYNKIGMPELFRSQLGKNLLVLQSWWMNYTMGYWREMLTRMFTGKTGYGKSIPVQWRSAALRHVATSLIFMKAVKEGFGVSYDRIALFGALPSGLSPVGQVIQGTMEYMGSGGDKRGQIAAKKKLAMALKAFIPGRAAVRDINNILDGDLKRGLFYPEYKPPDMYDKMMEKNTNF